MQIMLSFDSCWSALFAPYKIPVTATVRCQTYNESISVKYKIIKPCSR